MHPHHPAHYNEDLRSSLFIQQLPTLLTPVESPRRDAVLKT